MKRNLLLALAAITAIGASAQTQVEVMKITMTNGQEQTIKVADIKEMTFATEAEPSPAENHSGVYAGKQTLTVGGQMSYSADIAMTITEEADGSITVAIPGYELKETQMGDLTLGEITITGLVYDEAKGGYYRDYSNQGLQQHFTAVNGGQTMFDKDYDLGTGSTMLVVFDGNTMKVTNPFKLGAMPLPLVADFEGTK